LKPDLESSVKKLTVAATHNPSSKLLPAAIAVFKKSRPDVEVTFLTSNRLSVEKSVRDGEVDVALVQSPSDECKAELHVEHFAQDVLSVFTHPAHSLARVQGLTIDSLSRVSLIVRDGRGTTEKLLGLLRSRGIKLNIALRCATPEAVKAAVRNKMGVGILFRSMIDDEVRRRELKLLRIARLPPLVGSSFIVFAKTEPLPSPAAEFLALLRQLKSKQKRPLLLRKHTGTDPA
jgi:LysR family transcriptional regulator for metE and metH